MNRLASLTLVALLAVAGVAAASSMQVDENPAYFSSVTPFGGDLVLAMWDLQFSFDVTLSSGAAGNAGAEFNGTYYYSTRWAANLIHEYDLAGTMLRAFSVPGVSGLRDLAYDGTYFYGGAASSAIYKMSFTPPALISTITGSFQSRAIAYDEDEDQFYCSNWGDPVWIVQRNGSISGTINLVTTVSTYGFAYETMCSGDPTLWVFDQGSGANFPQYIHQWDLTAGSYTGVTHDVAADFPGTAGIAGGLYFFNGTLGGLLQGIPDKAFGYELCWGWALLDIDIEPVNGTQFNPGDVVRYAVSVTNLTGSPISVTARAYASNQSDWQLNLFGPITFNLPGGASVP